MPLPGSPGAYVANGSEHDDIGDTTHLPARHVQMTERRFSKLKLLEESEYERDRAEEPVVMMPWGGSKGPGQEAYNALKERGVPVGWAYTMFLNPLPPALLDELRQKELVIVPELNYQGQFAGILRSQGVRAEAITQYTGLPFKVRDLVNRRHRDDRVREEGDGRSMSKKNPEYDFKWCPGCGDFGVRRALEIAMIDRLETSGEPIENNVVVAGDWLLR